MSRKLVLVIITSILLVILHGSTAFARIISNDKSLDNYNVEVSNSVTYVPVPFHYQSNNYYCGPAALEMVFDYYEEDIPQTEIADVARTYPYVTYTDELRRAAHFSNLSTSLGNEIPGNITGYSARNVGYAAFHQWGLTIDDLKTLINRGEPLIVLMWSTPSKVYGHYRVVVGYNETHIIMHDPWNKDLWGGTYGGANISMTYSTFLDLWKYLSNWGLLVRPWRIELKMPSTVTKGDNFEVIANITYPCSTPFDTADYPASSCNASIKLQEGLELGLGETTQHSLGNIIAGNSIQTSWSIYTSETGFHNISVTVTGIVEGSVGSHGLPDTYPSYDYEDAIGGLCINSLSIIDQTCKVHNLNTGLNYTTIQEAIDANETLDGHTIFVEQGTYYENVAVDKAISLIGEDKYTTIIDGNQSGGALHVRSDNVVISNFTIQNCRTFGISSGVYVDHADHCKISNTAITNSTGGLFLFYSTNNTISGNTMDRNEFAFGVYGEEPGDFMHSIDTSNTVDGKPIYYLLNQKDIVINPIIHPQVGYLALVSSVNITVENLTLTNNWQGLLCVSTNNSKIAGNSIASNMIGIHLARSSGNIISGNHITSNGHGIGVAGPGIVLANCLLNIIIENHVSNNYIGINPSESSNNLIYHNVFANNTRQILNHNSVDVWDNDLEGNYWHDHTNLDLDYDGIADSWFEIDENNTDHYPLVGMFSSFNTSLGNFVNIVSNSTVEDFEYFDSNSTIKMYISGEEGFGFCRVSIPHMLMNVSNISVVIDDNQTQVLYPNYTLYDNGTHRWIYFAYEHSTHEIGIIPEFPSFLIIPLFTMATLLAVIVYKRKNTT